MKDGNVVSTRGGEKIMPKSCDKQCRVELKPRNTIIAFDLHQNLFSASKLHKVWSRRCEGGADNSIQCFRSELKFGTCFVRRQRREHQTTIIRNTYEKHLVHIILSDYVGDAGLRQGVHDNLSLATRKLQNIPASPLTNLPPSYFPDFLLFSPLRLPSNSEHISALCQFSRSPENPKRSILKTLFTFIHSISMMFNEIPWTGYKDCLFGDAKLLEESLIIQLQLGYCRW